MTNAIQRRDAREALRQLARARRRRRLVSDSGSARVVRAGKAGRLDPRRVPAAIEALFRTDLELKSSGDARVLLERLVVQLCRG